MVLIKSIVSSFIAFTAVGAIPTELKPRAAFTLANGQAAQALNRKFATLTANSACNAGENACVGGQFAQCAGGKFAVTGCAGGLKCFALPLVNSAGTSITCDTEADALARIANTGATGGLTGGAAVAAAPATGAAGATTGATGATKGAAKKGAKKGKGKKKGAKKGAKKAARDDHEDEEIDALIHELESHLATRDISDQFDVDSLTVEDLDAILEGLQRRDSLLERRGGVPPNVLKTLLNVIKSIFTKKAARDVDEFDGVSLADLEALVNSLERRHYDIERRGGVPPNVLQSLLNVLKGIFSKKKVARDIVERDFQSLIDEFIAKLFRPLKGVPKRELPAAVQDILKSVLDKLLQDLLGKIGGGAAAPAAAGAKREIPQELQDILKTVVDKLLQDLLGKIGGGAAAPATKREIPQEIQDILKTVLDKVLEGILSKIGGGAAAPAAGAKREIPQALQDIFKSILDKLLQTALSKIGGGAAAPAPAAPAANPAAEAPAAEEPAAAKRDLADTAKGIFKSLLDKLIAKLTGKGAAAPAAPAPPAEEPATEAPAEGTPAAEEPAAEEPAAAKRDLADTAKGIFKSLLDKLIAKLTGKGAAAPPPAEEPAAPAEEPAAEEPAAEAPAAEEPAAATPRVRRRHARDFTPIVADE